MGKNVYERQEPVQGRHATAGCNSGYAELATRERISKQSKKSYQLRCIFDPTELIFATLFRSVAGSRGRTGATHDSQSLDRTRHLSNRSIFRGRSGVGARHVYVIPFRVTSIHSDQEGFLFDVPEKAAKLHLIPIAFVGGDDTRKVSTKIEVETDMAGGTTVQCEAFAAVIASEPGVEAQVQR